MWDLFCTGNRFLRRKCLPLPVVPYNSGTWRKEMWKRQEDHWVGVGQQHLWWRTSPCQQGSSLLGWPLRIQMQKKSKASGEGRRNSSCQSRVQQDYRLQTERTTDKVWALPRALVQKIKCSRRKDRQGRKYKPPTASPASACRWRALCSPGQAALKCPGFPGTVFSRAVLQSHLNTVPQASDLTATSEPFDP